MSNANASTSRVNNSAVETHETSAGFGIRWKSQRLDGFSVADAQGLVDALDSEGDGGWLAPYGMWLVSGGTVNEHIYLVSQPRTFEIWRVSGKRLRTIKNIPHCERNSLRVQLLSMLPRDAASVDRLREIRAVVRCLRDMLLDPEFLRLACDACGAGVGVMCRDVDHTGIHATRFRQLVALPDDEQLPLPFDNGEVA